MVEHGASFSDDAIFDGEISVRQRRSGYRFSIDALLLAWYASAVPGVRMLELGTGCGVVSLALARRRPEILVDAVEVQESLFALAEENVEANCLGNIRVVQTDLRNLIGPDWEGRYDLVLSNPPYREAGRGRLNPEPEKALARHELLSKLEDFVTCAARTLTSRGCAAFVLLAERAADLESAADKSGLAIRHRCCVLPFSDKPANILLALLQRGPAGDQAEDQLIVYRSVGEYTPELKAIIAGKWEEVGHPLKALFH